MTYASRTTSVAGIATGLLMLATAVPAGQQAAINPEAVPEQHADVALIDILSAGFLREGLDYQAAAAMRAHAGDAIEAGRLRGEAEGNFRRAVHYGIHQGAYDGTAILGEPARQAATELGLALLHEAAVERIDDGLFWLSLALLSEGRPAAEIAPLLASRHAVVGLDAPRVTRAADLASAWLESRLGRTATEW